MFKLCEYKVAIFVKLFRFLATSQNSVTGLMEQPLLICLMVASFWTSLKVRRNKLLLLSTIYPESICHDNDNYKYKDSRKTSIFLEKQVFLFTAFKIKQYCISFTTLLKSKRVTRGHLTLWRAARTYVPSARFAKPVQPTRVHAWATSVQQMAEAHTAQHEAAL